MIFQVLSTPVSTSLDARVSEEVLDHVSHEASKSLPGPRFTDVLFDGDDFINSFNSSKTIREQRSVSRPLSSSLHFDHGEFDGSLAGHAELIGREDDEQEECDVEAGEIMK